MDEERMTKAIDLHFRGRPWKHAMLDAGYEKSYVAKFWRDWPNFPSVREKMQELVGFYSGMSREQWQTKMQEMTDLDPRKKEISFKDWGNLMRDIGGGLGLTRKDSSSHPTVPINIHIHREDVVIEAEGKVVS